MSKVSSRNPNIDAVRGIASFLIVFGHCRTDGWNKIISMSLAGSCIPFFLLVSGWFSYNISKEKMFLSSRRKLKDSAKMALIVAVLYFIWNPINEYLAGNPPFDWLIRNLHIKTLIFLVTINRAAFICSIMYYMLMMVYVYIIFGWLVKKDLLQKTRFLIPVLLVINVVLDTVVGVGWQYTGNFLLTGLPFFLLGHHLRAYYSEKEVPKSWAKWLWPAVFAGLALTILEHRFIGEAYTCIGVIITALAMFLLCLCYKESTRLEKLADFGRKYSSLMFVIHLGVRDLLNALFAQTAPPSYFWLRSVYVIIISLIIAKLFLMIMQLLNKRKQRPAAV